MIKRFIKRKNRARARLKQKLDSVAIDQLRQEVATLINRLEESEAARMYAEDNADFWQDQVMDINEQLTETPCSLGITQQGNVVLVER